MLEKIIINVWCEDGDRQSKTGDHPPTEIAMLCKQEHHVLQTNSEGIKAIRRHL